MRTIFTFAVAALALAGAAVAQPLPPASPKPIGGTPPVVVGEPGPDGRRIEAAGVFANFYPAHPGGPTVLLLGGSEGGLQPGGRGMVKALTDAGFNVLNVCYFGCPGTPPTLVSVPLETFDRALAWLRRQPEVDPDRIVLVGGSKGAEAGLLVAARHPEFKAVAVGMPSSVAWPGISFTAAGQPGWTEGDEPLPVLPYAPYTVIATGGILALYRDALPALTAHAEAWIPVERIRAPILLVCGEADTLWPSCPMARQIEARLAERGRPPAVLLAYPDAGHTVLGPPVDKAAPNYNRLAALGGTADGAAAARADAWPKVIAFLKAAVR